MRGDSLGDRMKEYESVPRAKLEPKVPVIARLDGKAFHTLTRGMDRPWDIRFQACMWNAARTLCESIQGCKIAYVQSDEISLLLTDWEKETTQGWFNYDLEKMCSVSASQATSAFLISMMVLFPERRDDLLAAKGLPAFDASFWNLPKEEVVNYFIWRQKDAIKNSVQMLARSVFSHKQCDRKSCDELKGMLLERNISWDREKNHCKAGACIIRVPSEEEISFKRGGVINTVTVQRHRWISDMDTPNFVEDREYISGLL